MTIDEMIRYIQDHNHDDEITESIVAALRAAQQMRLTAQQMAEDLYELSNSFEIALETWDAAVKGEEG